MVDYLVQPVQFQRNPRSAWEQGTYYVYPDGSTKLVDRNGAKIYSVFKYKLNWGEEVCYGI